VAIAWNVSEGLKVQNRLIGASLPSWATLSSYQKTLTEAWILELHPSVVQSEFDLDAKARAADLRTEACVRIRRLRALAEQVFTSNLLVQKARKPLVASITVSQALLSKTWISSTLGRGGQLSLTHGSDIKRRAIFRILSENIRNNVNFTPVLFLIFSREG
jgi:hypothetical protein